MWSDLSNSVLNRILDKIDEGLPGGERYTDGTAAKERAAWPIVINFAHKTERQAKAMIRVWLKSGVLERRSYHSEAKRKDVKGLWINAAKRPGTTQG
jgi:hypothetical protein